MSFLTDDEKRAAIGYGPMPMETPAPAPDFDTAAPEDERFNPYHDEIGRFTNAEGDAGGGGSSLVHLTGGGRGGLRGGRGRPPVTEEEARNLPPEKNPAVREGMARAERYDDAAADAHQAFRALRKLDKDAPRPNKPFNPDDPSEASTQQLRQYKIETEARIKKLSDGKRTVIYDFADDAPGNVFTKKDRQGSLSGDASRLSAHERKIVEERRADGVDAYVVTPRAEQGLLGRTNDVKFNGVNYEIKEAKTTATDARQISGSISKQIRSASGQRPPGQSTNILIDARGTSATKETAIDGMKRAGGHFDDHGVRSVDSITVLTPEGRVTVRRQK